MVNTELKHAAQDITLFLRLASLRIENRPEAMPFKAEQGQLVIGWLRALADRYGDGEDISGEKREFDMVELDVTGLSWDAARTLVRPYLNAGMKVLAYGRVDWPADQLDRLVSLPSDGESVSGHVPGGFVVDEG